MTRPWSLDAAHGASRVADFFANTGPTGQRAIAAIGEEAARAVVGRRCPPTSSRAARPMARRSPSTSSPGRAATAAPWSRTWASRSNTQLTDGPGALGADQPHRRSSSCRCCPTGARTAPSPCRTAPACGLPPPPDYSEDPSSAFYKEALEVYETVKTPRRRSSARSPASGRTTRCCRRRRPATGSRSPCRCSSASDADLDDARRRAGAARHRAGRRLHRLLGRQVRLRPGAADHLHPPRHRPEVGAAADHAAVPRISERPQHAVGAAAAVLTAVFGEDFAFEDATHEADGLDPRTFAELLGGGRGGRHLAALWRHPLPRGDRARASSRAAASAPTSSR